MSWLFVHDVWPGWSADAPPPLRPSAWLREEGEQSQFSIHLMGVRVGTIWSTYTVGDHAVQRRDTIWVQTLPIAIAPIRLTIDSTYTAEGLLDEFTVQLERSETDIMLHGERFHSDFSFRFERGPIERAFKIPLAEGGTIGGGFNPFSQLSDLSVGQKWRMQVFNPVAALTGLGDRFIPILVEVTGEELIDTPSGRRRCVIVESPNAMAWVDAHGAVLVQEIELPLVGRFRIVREQAFDADKLAEIRKRRFN